MSNVTLAKRKSNKHLLKSLAKEIRLLQNEVDQLKRQFWENLPEEDIEDYAHPEKILKAREEALKQYPPKI